MQAKLGKEKITQLEATFMFILMGIKLHIK